ncbi:Imm21 family immunity protein [Haloferula rosea]|uniref:Imm21 family immunity protein n=1 Tax=Haloferula rosea TaxID=490093 RepID=UPI002D7EAB14|nr:Imm21 family immunity protein [Haloferula rosea]
MNSASSLGGPYVLVQDDRMNDWVRGIGPDPDPKRGLYGRVCKGGSLIERFDFEGSEVLRISDEPSDLLWRSLFDGGLVVQWVAAESEEDLIRFAETVAAREVWDESCVLRIRSSSVTIMDALGRPGDGEAKIVERLEPGDYQVDACLAEDDDNEALIVRLRRTSSLEVPAE